MTSVQGSQRHSLLFLVQNQSSKPHPATSLTNGRPVNGFCFIDSTYSIQALYPLDDGVHHIRLTDTRVPRETSRLVNRTRFHLSAVADITTNEITLGLEEHLCKKSADTEFRTGKEVVKTIRGLDSHLFCAISLMAATYCQRNDLSKACSFIEIEYGLYLPRARCDRIQRCKLQTIQLVQGVRYCPKLSSPAGVVLQINSPSCSVHSRHSPPF
jgi:hypothetical protein